MKLLRRIGFILGLALVVAMGQQAGLLHGLAHASERMSQKQGAPAVPPACDQCALFAQLDGMASTPVPPLPEVATHAVVVTREERSQPTAAPVVFLSRAPPVLL
jgi:NaMN:DMB phosphoribosyltransferase